ncbi:MAG TPA: NAD(P)-binding protein [Vicinamibacterales bacterium]|nr:NAD(P)-binding protein [Vicinamibacterales bacterium]
MNKTRELRELGMHRRIPRRDFLNGMALGVAGATTAFRPAALHARAQTPGAEPPYPPARLGLRGQHPSTTDALSAVRRGDYAAYPGSDVDTSETYDLVIVGGGLSGLAAAYFWHQALPNQRVLVLDNHDDFGGHAKRNEFSYQGRTFLGYGGTMSVATPYPYSYMSKALLVDLGVEVGRNAEFADRDLFQKFNLGPAMFFDQEHFGEDRLVPGNGRVPWDQFFAAAPLSDAARRDLVRLHGKNPDYMTGKSVEQKQAELARISHQDFLLQHAKMSPEALPFFLSQGGRNNKRVDTTPALEAARAGRVGFDGLGLPDVESFRQGSFTFHFPDGNASLARLVVSRLVPKAIPGHHDMSTIVKAPPVAYDRLDDRDAATRIRLNSTVTRVALDGPAARPDGARIAYLRDGKMHQVRAESVVLACYNALIPRLVPELPADQKQALADSVKVPMLYTNLLIRRWTSFQKLGVASINAPGMYHPRCSLDPGSTVGGYKGVTTPDEPIVVHMVRNPNKPGLPRKEQNRIGQQELLAMTFHDFELSIRRQMARMLASTDFDPAADLVGLAVNRWPDGYAYTYDTLADPDVPPEQRPHVVGRRRFGPVTIANSDAGAAAFTNQAFDEAHRAVQELLVSRGMA